MRAFITADVEIDLMSKTSEVAEFAKAAAVWGFDFALTPDPSEASSGVKRVATLRRDGQVFLQDELARLLYFGALSTGKSLTDTLTQLRRDVEKFGKDMDCPLFDQKLIGE